jgi:protein-tyrosine-phosphatase
MHILFLCVANSARSQIAEGLARHAAPSHWQISSAGSQPTQVRPEAITCLAEQGIDITGHVSKGTQDFDANKIDWVITLCAEEACPASLLGAPRLYWPVKDPAIEGTQEERMSAFRRARDEIHELISGFLREKTQTLPNSSE